MLNIYQMVFGVSSVNLDFEGGEGGKKKCDNNVGQVWHMIYSINSTVMKPH